MTITKYLMTPGDVARVLGVTATRVRQLDAVLRPIRVDGRGNPRRYDPAAVQRYTKRRARDVRGAK